MKKICPHQPPAEPNHSYSSPVEYTPPQPTTLDDFITAVVTSPMWMVIALGLLIYVLVG